MKNGQVGDDELVREIDAAVTRVNEDSRWVSKVWCVSTIEENEARRNRILRRQARTEGREEGRTEGRAEGRVEGEQRFAALAERLLAEGRSDDLLRATRDVSFRRQLLDEE